jgi:predicted NAD/FAD-dependent oxidoreductase
MSRIAIIGAGLAGLTLARQLQKRASVVVFEKSRNCGGRMATRYRTGYQFDHGAQFFTVRSQRFKDFITPYINAGVIARWDARFVELERNVITARRNWTAEHPHYVATPGMSALGQAMAGDLSVRLNTIVSVIEKTHAGWRLADGSGQDLGVYDWVVTAMPAPQSARLLPELFAHIRAVEDKQMLGCYSLMLGFEQPLPLDWDVAWVAHADVSWICNNASKPGRPDKYTLLVHSTNVWADANMERDHHEVTRHLVDETCRVIGHNVSKAEHIDLHRWRYANIQKQSGEPALIDTNHRLAAIGDWCIKGRIESAFLSAMEAAEQLGTVV